MKNRSLFRHILLSVLFLQVFSLVGCTIDASIWSSLTAGPAIQLSPALTNVSNNPTPAFEVSGVSSGSSVVLYNDNHCQNKVAEVVAGSSTVSISSSSLADGQYYFSSRIVSSDGKTTTCVVWKAGPYVLDTQAPTTPTALNTAATTTSNRSPALSWTASTDVGGSGIRKYQVRIIQVVGSVVVATWRDLVSGGYISPLSLTQGSSYYFELRAVDRAGNISGVAQSSNWTVTSTTIPLISGVVQSAVVQTDNKRILGGSPLTVGGVTAPYVIRLNADGGADTTMDFGVGTDGEVKAVARQSDGKYILAGNFENYRGTAVKNIVRVNTDGTIDSSFSTVGSGVNGHIRTVVVQNDGAILIGGSFTSYNGTSRNFLARLQSSGALDTTFTVGTGFTGAQVDKIVLKANGQLVVGGIFSQYNGTSRSAGLAQINSDGSLDNSFNLVLNGGNMIDTFSVDSNGKVLIAGNFSTAQGVARSKMARLNSDSTLDTTFNVQGSGFVTFSNPGISAIEVLSDGDILVGGQFTSYNGVSRELILRLNDDGTLDTSFDAGSSSAQSIKRIALQSDGKILTFEAQPYRLKRLNADGSADSSFLTLTEFSGDTSSHLILSDDRIVVSGSFEVYAWEKQTALIRLNSDGSVDSGFNIGDGFDGDVYTLLLRGTKVLVGGSFTTFDGNPAANLIQLNADGSQDNSFDIGDGFDGSINKVALQ
ncbi:MAG: delta-60 repeat domain-containing protein, partial [Bdellovibrio sp.]